METPETAPATPLILIVEDSRTQAMLLQHALEQHGYRVLAAACGEDALASLRHHRPTLIISDINMPGMDGYEFCRRIKGSPDTQAVPVFLLTTLSDPKDVIRGLECGASGFLTKPYQEDLLLARIQYILTNMQLRQAPPAETIVEVYFAGQKYAIASGKQQILDFLLSMYDTAVQQNRELKATGLQLERQKDELARSNAELEQFAYVASHDLQEPLRKISSFGRLLNDHAGAALDATARDYVARMMDAAGRMQRLIADLLTYARVDTRGAEFLPVALRPVVDQALDDLGERLRESGGRVDIGDLPVVLADARQMYQLFQNIIGNALKFVAKGQAPVVRVSGRNVGPGKVEIAVQDNGIGFDEKDLDRIFQPFQRLHTRDQYPGSGIGLAVCRKIVQRHGGDITARSRPGAGSTFLIALKSATDCTSPSG
jgi:signal transduction histidine kinase